MKTGTMWSGRPSARALIVDRGKCKRQGSVIRIMNAAGDSLEVFYCEIDGRAIEGCGRRGSPRPPLR